MEEISQCHHGRFREAVFLCKGLEFQPIINFAICSLESLCFNENRFNMASELEKGAQLSRLWLSFQPFMQMMGHYTSCFVLLDDQNSCILRLLYGHVRIWSSYYA